MIDLTIIIPHYNSPKLLKKLLLSIPNKSNIQTIVVDDKSNEELEELMYIKNSERFQHILFVNNDSPNKGAGVCRNIGLSNAKGKWILFADSDDFFLEDFYKKVNKYFDSNYDVVFYKPTSINLANGLINGRHKPYEKLIDNFLIKKNKESELQLRYMFFVPWSKLVRKDFIENNKIHFDEVLASNDVMFSTKVGYFMQKFKADPSVIYCVTRSGGTLTTTINPHIFEARLDTYINYNVFIREKLSKSELKAIPTNGLNLLIDSVRYRLGFKNTSRTFLKLILNNVPLIDKRFINPFFLISKFKSITRKRLK